MGTSCRISGDGAVPACPVPQASRHGRPRPRAMGKRGAAVVAVLEREVMLERHDVGQTGFAQFTVSIWARSRWSRLLRRAAATTPCTTASRSARGESDAVLLELRSQNGAKSTAQVGWGFERGGEERRRRRAPVGPAVPCRQRGWRRSRSPARDRPRNRAAAGQAGSRPGRAIARAHRRGCRRALPAEQGRAAAATTAASR